MWGIAVLAALAALLVLALYVPRDLAFHGSTRDKPRFGARFSWFFGLVNKDIEKGKARSVRKKKAKAKRRRRAGDGRVFLDIIRTRGLLKQVVVLVKSILGCIHIRDTVLDLKIGLEDPADTGLFFSFAGPIAAFMNLYTTHIITLQPSTGDGITFECYTQGKARLRPIELVPPLLKFIFSAAFFRAAGIVIIRRWKRKK